MGIWFVSEQAVTIRALMAQFINRALAPKGGIRRWAGDSE